MDTTRETNAKIMITKFIKNVCTKMQKKSGQTIEEACG
jgi:hypothetical protein